MTSFQSSMHSERLATLNKQLMGKKMVKCAKVNMKNNNTSTEIYDQMEDIFIEMDQSPDEETTKIGAQEPTYPGATPVDLDFIRLAKAILCDQTVPYNLFSICFQE